jgi:hypothetical protein
MNYFKVAHYMVKVICLFIFFLLSSCSENKLPLAEQTTLADYTVGEQWTWKYKGVTTEGEDKREIVQIDGDLGMTVENDTIPLSDIVKPEESKTPRYKWPLEVGKTWTYEKNWTSQDGTTGTQNQEAKVVSYKAETVVAGTFMAYTIEYKGTVSNSRGYNAKTDEVWLYAPEIKNFIKMTQTQDGFLYNEELIKYENPNKK